MSTSRGSAANTPADDLSSGALLAEDLPPAYTAIPDSRHGETTVEFGPSRPFQPPSPQPRLRAPIQPAVVASPWSAAPRPATSGWQSAWSGYPGQLHRSTTSASSSSSLRPPPPRHPSSASRASDDLFPSFSRSANRQTYASPPPPFPPSQVVPAQATSDFARDFYSAGQDDTALLGGSSNQYAPPSGPPPPPTPSSPSGAPDDGRPTERPIPGHPLMNGGRVLVYPAGYECHKCKPHTVLSTIISFRSL
jgi:hypothetical protein